MSLHVPVFDRFCKVLVASVTNVSLDTITAAFRARGSRDKIMNTRIIVFPFTSTEPIFNKATFAISLSNKDLNKATENLRSEQDKLEKISKDLILNSSSAKDVEVLKNSLINLDKSQEYIKDKKIELASNLLDKTKDDLKMLISNFENKFDNQVLDKLNGLNNKIKIFQENYATAYSKNQTIKADSIKRQERIKNIGSEINNWKNLNSNSEKMMAELAARKEKIMQNLNNLEKVPESISIEKGQTLQNIKITEEEKIKIEDELKKADLIFEEHNNNLKISQEKTMLAREKRASA